MATIADLMALPEASEVLQGLDVSGHIFTEEELQRLNHRELIDPKFDHAMLTSNPSDLRDVNGQIMARSVVDTRFRGGSLETMKIRNIVLQGCLFQVEIIDMTTWENVHMINCRFRGVFFAESNSWTLMNSEVRFEGCTFEDCRTSPHSGMALLHCLGISVE